MMIGMVADMPVLIDDARTWRPITYEEHFESSGLSIGPLAIEAYEACEPQYRDLFDETLQLFNDRALRGCEDLARIVAEGDAEYIAHSANSLSLNLQGLIDQLGAIIHGASGSPVVEESEGLSQDDIDALF